MDPWSAAETEQLWGTAHLPPPWLAHLEKPQQNVTPFLQQWSVQGVPGLKLRKRNVLWTPASGESFPFTGSPIFLDDTTGSQWSKSSALIRETGICLGPGPPCQRLCNTTEISTDYITEAQAHSLGRSSWISYLWLSESPSPHPTPCSQGSCSPG